jgi:hypothetical protein
MAVYAKALALINFTAVTGGDTELLGKVTLARLVQFSKELAGMS